MKIIDNFLPEKDFQELVKAIVWSPTFPFYLNSEVSAEEDDIPELNNWYGNAKLLNPMPMFKPLLEYFNDKAFRLKVNFYPHTEKIYEHKPHIDFPYEHKGAILSLNTCDGFTRLEDNTKIESIANRILFFDSSKLHNSSTTTNTKGRFNININYL